MASPAPLFRPVGYEFLRRRHGLKTPLYHVTSFVAEQGARRIETGPTGTREIYPKAAWPGEDDFDHLEFALRREGVDFPLLLGLFPLLGIERTAAYVAATPTGIYTRRIWYLFEEYTGENLGLPDLAQGNYVPLLDPEQYYTAKGFRSKRQRILVNHLGDLDFAPMVRRTEALRVYEEKNLDVRCQEVLDKIPAELYQRTLQYLYTRETKSSFAIERETPDQARASRFATLLQGAAQSDYLEKATLVSLQNAIVDPRFRDEGWRDATNDQVYVGSSMAGGEHVHFIAPRPQEIDELMEAFEAASRGILASPLHPVIAAAAIAYPFVFLHPFHDGNGRIHRFLIHYVLAQRKFVPEGMVFPVSAIMLHHPKEYEESLEDFSRRIQPLIEYTLDDDGRMTVHHDTARLYRFIDCTRIAELLFWFVERTIEDELPTEIAFLRQYDAARRTMREVVDLPNREADLFVRLCRANNFRLSATKRKMFSFSQLTDTEIAGLENAVRQSFRQGT